METTVLHPVSTTTTVTPPGEVFLVVQRYSKKCNAAFAQLSDDGYVYQKLLGHVAASGTEEHVVG